MYASNFEICMQVPDKDKKYYVFVVQYNLLLMLRLNIA